MTTIVADTSPINYLVLIGQIEVLPSLFGEILIPPAVHRELQRAEAPPPVVQWAKSLPAWARLVAPKNIDESLDLDAGETEAISLAGELKADGLLIDERTGRQAARDRGIHTIGTLLILSQADEQGLLDFEIALQRLLQTSFRVSQVIVDSLTKRVRARKNQN